MDITVSGEGSSQRPPERATVHLNIGLELTDKQRAVRETTELANKVSADIARLRALDPAPVTWSAVSALSIVSWTPQDDKGRPLPPRHQASCSVKVKFADFDALSVFVDTWAGVSGVTTGRVDWTVTDSTRTDLERQVLGLAVQQAYERATAIAEACGLTRVVCTEAADPGLLGGTHAEASPIGMARAMRGPMMADGHDDPDAIKIVPEDVRIAASLHLRFQAS